MLQLQPSFFKENEVYIHVICPMLCECEKIGKGSKGGKGEEYATRFDTWAGMKDLVFLIPRNFNNLNQKAGGRTTVEVNDGVNEE